MPEADLLPALPQLLGPLLAMVADPNRELRQAVLKTLQVPHSSILSVLGNRPWLHLL